MDWYDIDIAPERGAEHRHGSRPVFRHAPSRAHPVVLIVQGGQAILHDAAGEEVRRAPLASLRVSERNKRAPRLVTFDDGAYCEVADHARFEAMLASTGHREGWVSRAQNSWRLTGLALLGILAFVLGAYFYLLPWSAGLLAGDRAGVHRGATRPEPRWTASTTAS